MHETVEAVAGVIDRLEADVARLTNENAGLKTRVGEMEEAASYRDRAVPEERPPLTGDPQARIEALEDENDRLRGEADVLRFRQAESDDAQAKAKTAAERTAAGVTAPKETADPHKEPINAQDASTGAPDTHDVTAQQREAEIRAAQQANSTGAATAASMEPPPPPEAAQQGEEASPAEPDTDALQTEAEALGIKVDRRWGDQRLQDEIAKAQAAKK